MRCLFLFFGLVVCWSCRTEMDAPPDFIEPDIASNTTIKSLKARHSMGALEQITEDLVIEGIVVADDRTGNFYKSIVIQDGTGGITLHLDDYHLYTAFTEGRKLFIKMKGLYLGDYNGLIQ